MSNVKNSLALIAALVVVPTWAADLQFSEATKACRLTATEHEFRLKISITPARNSYSFAESTPFTECLAKEASAIDETGNPRRVALGASLDRAVKECSEKFGPAKSFDISFTPTPTHFAIRTGREHGKTHTCITMLSSMVQGFGAPK